MSVTSFMAAGPAMLKALMSLGLSDNILTRAFKISTGFTGPSTLSSLSRTQD